MLEENMVRKILISLSKKFDMKVTTIEKSQDVSTLKVHEFIGSLKTFEISINERSEKKNKGVAFVSNTQENEDQSDKENEESYSDVIAFVIRKVNKYLKNLDRKWRTNVQDIRFDIGP